MAFALSISSVAFLSPQQHHLWKGDPSSSALTHSRCKISERNARTRSHTMDAKTVIVRPEIDFTDPNWKQHYQEDFDKRFNLPHLKDVLDVKPRPTTFSLLNRGPLQDGNGALRDRPYGYVNDDDRALLKIVFTLEKYGVKKIVGIPFGYRGFFDEGLPEIPLSRQFVQNINLNGGSVLGVSRGGGNTNDIVDNIQARGIDMLFVLGGNGTHAGANAIHDECRRRRLKVSVVGVPKTIDNDILLMDKTFGFDTAVEEAQRAICSAYIEAHSAYHGIGLVKLMGRSSGFIAMHASLSSGQIDICLIPEALFKLEGPHGVLQHLEHLIKTKGSAVVCVAEGAGQELLEKSNATDASGNAVLSDIGVHIQQKIKSYFKGIGVPADVKYIDPTYMIRACRANASDAILCTVLGQNAVHGAFAGFSGITTGICNTHYVYLPIPEVITSPRCVDPNSRMWHRCLTSTGQPDFV